MKIFKVHTGYDRCGRERNQYFATMADARAYCEYVFKRSGFVLSIVRVGK